MSTILEALKGINPYPIPLRTLNEVAGRRGVDLEDSLTPDVYNGKGYNLVRADLMMWLSFAPSISQGGQSYSFTDEQRTDFQNLARQLYDEYTEEEDAPIVKNIYGYKGNRL